MQRARTVLLVIVVAVVVVVAALVSYIALTPSSTSSSPSKVPSGNAYCPTPSGGTGSASWTTYHQNNDRNGTVVGASVLSPHILWTNPPSLDGQVYAEPLVCGNSVFVATEDDSVYAINATNGTVVWHTHLGTPMPGSALPCGDISPSGITGTPVIDTATGTIYVVAFMEPGTHELFGLDLANGTVRSHVDVDPAGISPLVEQERGALLLANGYVYVPYGGLFGDCGNYHGYVVGAPVSGSGGNVTYMVPTHREGGIWGTAGFAIASNGDLYVATGNGDSNSVFDHGDAVIELSPTLTELGYFAPTNWAQLNQDDTDLGSVAPTILPNGDVFEIGKAGVGYLLSGTNLGGIGGQIGEQNICGGAYGGTAHLGNSIFVPCTNGVFDVAANATNVSVVWQSSANFDAGSPIVTGNVVWAVDISTGHLLGFGLANGTEEFNLNLGPVDHFISPAAGPGVVYVGGQNVLYAIALT